MPSLSPTRLHALHERVRQEVADGLVSGAQLAIGLDGTIVAFDSFGSATNQHSFALFSATKTIVAMALLPHLADGSLDLTTPVAHYLRAFGHHGKDDVTVLQLLTMQGGFPQAPIGPDSWGTSEGRRAKFAEWQLDWRAGARTEYHPVSAHWVIGELLQTLNGREYIDVVHDRVVAPAGVDRLLGPAVNDRDFFGVRSIGEFPADPADLIATYGRADLVPEATIGHEALLTVNHPAVRAAGIPGGGGVCTAAEAALIYQTFLHPTGALPTNWLTDAVGTVRNASVNVSDKVPANRTVTGYTAGNDGYHLHRWMPQAPRAFGHAGAGGQLCWVDPDSGLSLAFLHDTLHMDPRVEFHRAADINSLALRLVD